jgi:PAS domain S-box-containing protein
MTTWSTAQLIAFQAAVSQFTEEEGALRTAVELALEMFDAAAGAVLQDDRVVMAVGFPRSRVPLAALHAACDGRTATLTVEGVGACEVALADVEGDPACRLVLARAGDPFDAGELALIRSMGRMLSVTLRVVRLIQSERALHEERERQLDENALLHRFRSAFDDVDVGMAMLGHGGRFSRVNPKLGAILGYDAEELLGVRYHDLLDPEDRAESERVFAELMWSGATSVAVEQRLLRPGGEAVWLEVTISRGEPNHLVVQAQDVTERRLVETALRESEDRYRSLVEHLPLIVFRNALDLPGTGLYVSPQVEATLGYPISRWHDDEGLFDALLHPDDRERVRAALADVLHTGEDLSCEYRMLASDGRTVAVRQQGTVLRDERGQPVCVQGYILDISEQRQLEQQLRLAQKLEAVGQLAAGIAHEINTPIQFVGDSLHFAAVGVTDLMKLVDTYREIIAGTPSAPRAAAAEERADLPYLHERLPPAFARMDEGVRRIAAIVGAMKDFAHPRSGAHGHVDVNAALESTLVVTHAQYKYVADVETDLGTLPFVMADDGELKQVFVNLIVNAAHAIEDTVGDSGDHGTIRISTRTDGDDAVITVADSGGGIPEQLHDRVFDPFFTTKKVGRGTGQGLAISRSIVTERHGGTILLESAPGRGTTFEIRLPIKGAPALEPAA